MQLSINLATRYYYDRNRFKVVLICVIVLCLLLIGVGISRFIVFRAKSEIISAQTTELNKRLAGQALDVSGQKYNRHNQQVAILNKILAQRQNSQLIVLDRLESSIPNGVAYTLIAPDHKDKLLRLEGRTRSLAVLAELLERLGGSNDFKNPTLVSTGDVISGEPAGIRFVITLGWDGA